MSWEQCGFRPGWIHGPGKCPRGACADCDGEHHFYVHSVNIQDDDPEDRFGAIAKAVAAGETDFFACKHCDTWADLVDEDEDSP